MSFSFTGSAPKGSPKPSGPAPHSGTFNKKRTFSKLGDLPPKQISKITPSTSTETSKRSPNDCGDDSSTSGSELEEEDESSSSSSSSAPTWSGEKTGYTFYSHEGCNNRIESVFLITNLAFGQKNDHEVSSLDNIAQEMTPSKLDNYSIIHQGSQKRKRLNPEIIPNSPLSSTQSQQWRNNIQEQKNDRTWSLSDGNESIKTADEMSDSESKRTDVHSYQRINTEILQKAQQLAQIVNGECLSKVCINFQDGLTFKCQFNHVWKSTVALEIVAKQYDQQNSNRSVLEKFFCPFCKKYFEHWREVAQKNEGFMLSEKPQQFINFKCKKGHLFSIKLNKIKNKRWCLECYQEDVKEAKKKELEEAERKQKEMQKHQEELLNKARSQMTDEQQKKDIYNFWMQQDCKLNLLAKQHSLVYMKKHSQEYSKAQFEKLFYLYKVLLANGEYMGLTLHLLNGEQKKAYFRKYARYVHPDKNSHPYAKMAFQKLALVFNSNRS